MSQILTKIEGILKDKYQPALANMITVEPSPFLEMIRKTPLTNNTIKYAAPIGINGGFGFGYEGTNTPKAASQRFVNFEVDAVDMYVDIQISNKTVQLASSNVSSMINALDAEVKGSYASAKWNVGRSIFGSRKGNIAKIVVAGTNVNKFKLDSLVNVIEGVVVDIYASGAVEGATPTYTERRIISVEHAANTVTFDGAPMTLAVGAFLTVQGSFYRELTGLADIFDTTSTTLYGLNKAQNPWLIPTVVDCNEYIDDNYLYDGIKRARDYRGSNINLLMMGDYSFKDYRSYMKKSNTQITDKHNFVGGATGFSILVGDQEVTIINEHRVPPSSVYGVDTTAFSLEATPWEFMAKDGSVFVPMANTSVYRALLASYGNLICTNPGGCVHFLNCNFDG